MRLEYGPGPVTYCSNSSPITNQKASEILNTSSLRFHTYTHTYQLYNNNVIKGACTLYTHTPDIM